MITAQIIAIVGTIAVGIYFLYKLHENFTERLFFQFGMLLFIIQGLANSYGMYLNWAVEPIWSKISSVAGILFNFLIAYFFYYMTKKMPSGIQYNENELDSFMKGVKPKK